MPIYEYRCQDCRKRSSIFVLNYKEQVEPICSHCGGKNLTRIMSRFATVRSEDARLESLAEDPGLGDVDEGDPRSVGRFMKKMGREFGDELGDDFEGAMEEATAAEESEDGGEDDLPEEPRDSSYTYEEVFDHPPARERRKPG